MLTAKQRLWEHLVEGISGQGFLQGKAPRVGVCRRVGRTARKPVWPEHSKWGRNGKMSKRRWQEQIVQNLAVCDISYPKAFNMCPHRHA